MQYSKLAFLAAMAAPLAIAQDLSALPSCAQGPAIAALGSTGCALTDITCVCKNTGFITGLTPAIQKACSPADFAKATQFAITLCASVGVTLTPPGGATSTPAAAVTSTSTVAVTTTTAVVETTTAVVQTTTPSATETSTAAAVTVISDGQPQAPVSTASAAPVPSTNATVTSAPATPSPFKGAAASFGAQMVSVVVAVGAVGFAFAL